MFDDSPTWSRFKTDQKRKIIRVQLGHVPEYEENTPEERFSRRMAIVISAIVYIGLLVVHLPALDAEPQRATGERPVYVVQQIRFSPPPAPEQQKQIPKPQEKRKVIPVPDLTPDELEPIRTLEIEVPDFEVSETSGETFGIPDAPPQKGPTGPAPLRVGGDIAPPQKIFHPRPDYTEDARRAQVQGVVILEAIVDKDGSVRDVKVLKGLPMGLSESAIESAKQWRFEPATRRGVPVAVILNLTISFSLQ